MNKEKAKIFLWGVAAVQVISILIMVIAREF